MEFTKMYGAGQDYVVVDCFTERAPRSPHGLALEVSDRQRGVGAQGLIVIHPSESVDAQMKIYSAFGEEQPHCSNALRCVAKYLFDRKICTKQSLRIDSGGTVFGVDVSASSEIAQQLRLDMGEPVLAASKIPTRLPHDGEPGKRVVNAGLQLGDFEIRITCVSIRGPHCVVFVDQDNDDIVSQLGPAIECAEDFPERTNVEFVQVVSPSEVRQRSWKRGYGEVTSSCEGAAAGVVAAVLTQRTDRSVTTQLPGGTFQMEWDSASNRVFLTGSAVEVFSGRWNGLS